MVQCEEYQWPAERTWWPTLGGTYKGSAFKWKLKIQQNSNTRALPSEYSEYYVPYVGCSCKKKRDGVNLGESR